jgi:hypothetical protein
MQATHNSAGTTRPTAIGRFGRPMAVLAGLLAGIGLLGGCQLALTGTPHMAAARAPRTAGASRDPRRTTDPRRHETSAAAVRHTVTSRTSIPPPASSNRPQPPVPSRHHHAGAGRSAQAGKPSSRPPVTIADVVFSGDATSPTVTVSGGGFGAEPPTAYPADQTTCGSYDANGNWYGSDGLVFEDARSFDAGLGTIAGDSSCIGLLVTTWSPTEVVFSFGEAYTVARSYLHDGDSFTMTVLGRHFSGMVEGLTGAVGTTTAGTTRPLVTSVSFEGTTASPTITIEGSGFGPMPPTAYDAMQTDCGNYAGNGAWYGLEGLVFRDLTAGFSAGDGTTVVEPSCIGLVVNQWTPTVISFSFGDAYGTSPGWTVGNGDEFLVTVLGADGDGTVGSLGPA